MDTGTAAVLAAIVTTVGAVIVALIQRGRRENKDDHALVMGAIRHVVNVVDRVDRKLDRHLDDHEQGKFSGRP